MAIDSVQMEGGANRPNETASISFSALYKPAQPPPKTAPMTGAAVVKGPHPVMPIKR